MGLVLVLGFRVKCVLSVLSNLGQVKMSTARRGRPLAHGSIDRCVRPQQEEQHVSDDALHSQGPVGPRVGLCSRAKKQVRRSHGE